MICTEERNSLISDSVVKRKKSELGDMHYIDFKIALTKGEGELLKYQLTSAKEYEKRVNYFSFGMENDIKLIDGTDTIPCALFHFERVYDIAPYCTFALGFPAKKNTGENKTLVYHDTIFKKGIIKFEFVNSDLKAVPTLQTQ